MPMEFIFLIVNAQIALIIHFYNREKLKTNMKENNRQYLGEDVVLEEREFNDKNWEVKYQGKVVQETEDKVNVKIFIGTSIFGREAHKGLWWPKNHELQRIEIVETDGIFRFRD